MTLPVFAGVRVLGVDDRRVASPGPTPPGPRELTGIVDHSRGGSSHGPLEWTWSRVGLVPCMRTGWPSAANSFAPVSRSRRWIPSRDSKNASVRPSRQMRRISVSTSPTFTGQVCEVFHQATPTQGQRLAGSSHPAPTSLSHPRNRSPRGEPYVSGRTSSWPTSIPAEQATAPRKPSTDIIELGRRIARGYRNPTSYQLRMLLIAGGLDAFTHTQL